LSGKRDKPGHVHGMSLAASFPVAIAYFKGRRAIFVSILGPKGKTGANKEGVVGTKGYPNCWDEISPIVRNESQDFPLAVENLYSIAIPV
jgi:hypothetical protein